jgi:hypothetical protein|tara:strand:- start:573 stop:968 length:396 start_codon:yes stop_codon:yes gene_type:complete
MSTLGGNFNGQSVQKTQNAMVGGEVAMKRKILRKAFGSNTVNNVKSSSGPFRAAFHLGDPLGRKYYSCGVPNQVSSSSITRSKLADGVPQQCDGTNIPLESGNSKFISDASLFTRFKGLEYSLKNYNDNAR